MRRAPVVLWGACVALCAAGASGQLIPAGEDLYRAEGEPWIEFGGDSGFEEIDGGTFGPGSDPFDGIIYFRSNPIPDHSGQTDTIVKRLQDADVSGGGGGGGSATVETELVELNLVSTSPIHVTYYEGMIDSFFDVYMEIFPPDPVSEGTMTITDGGGSGGGIYTMYAADGDGVDAYYRFIFVETSPPLAGRGIAPPIVYDPPSNPHLTTLAYPGDYQYARPPKACNLGNKYYPVPGLAILLQIDSGMSGAVGLVPCRRGWQPGDLHKMHFPQLPDEQGWDVDATSPLVLAEDWMCTESGPVKDIHLWGSWKDMDGDGHGDEGNILSFNLSIHDNIPPGTGPTVLVYENTIATPSMYYAPGAGGYVRIADDMTLAGTERHLLHYEFWVNAPSGSAPYTVTSELHTDSAGLPGTAISGTSCQKTVTADGFVWVDCSPGLGAILPGTVHMVLSFSDNSSGWVITETAEVGSTADSFGLDDGTGWTQVWFGGTPYAGFGARIWCGEEHGYSMPGTQVWGAEIVDFDMVPIDPPTLEAWLDPPYEPWMSIPNDHDAYFQYNIELPPSLWFWQNAGDIYWLDVSAVLADPFNTRWGWKSTIDHWNDDAVWWDTSDQIWKPLIEPPRENWYDVVVDMAGNVVAGSGTNAYTDPDGERQWFYYPEYGWWNIWFYDNPFRTDNYKSGWLNFTVIPVDLDQPGVIRVAINWSTAAWSLEGNPPGPRRPPLPVDDNEDLFIGRLELPGSPWTFGPDGLDIYEYFDIMAYNPEWISVDIQGSNFMIVGPGPRGGIIQHECVQTSMDLAFVITPGPPGACCYPDAVGGGPTQCVDGVTEGACIFQYGGVWQGPYSVCRGMEPCCLPDGSCVFADALCCVNELGGQPQGTTESCNPAGSEACCLPDNSCVMADPLCCENEMNGTAMGPLSTCGGAMEACCLDDNSCVMADIACCVGILHGMPQGAGSQCSLAMEACCLQNDTCVMADPLCCVNELGGDPQGPGTVCTQPEACCVPDPSGLGAFTCEDLDPLCCVNKQGIPQGPGTMCGTDTIACCVQGGAQCFDVDPLCCDEMGGVPSTWSLVCLGDANQNGINDACEPPPTGACCLDDGSCQDLTEAACNMIPNAVFKGVGTRCFGDMNGNGIDDACEAPWQPGDPHKMHFPQLPDETGWDVFASYPVVLADDWQCSQSGWVTDVHFWGSWKDDIVGEIQYFVLSIHADIPANPPVVPYSRPGTTLWEREIYNFVTTPVDPPTAEGWYDPTSDPELILPNNHGSYFQYDVYLPPNVAEGFWQEEGTIYWLNISAVLAPGPSVAQWGWKSSVDHWNDDAVWAYWGNLNWIDLWEPYKPVTDNYYIAMNPDGVPEGRGGSGYNDGWWYYYPNLEPGWWNQWFYDHPFYPDRWKEGAVQFAVRPFYEQFESWIVFAINYSTPAWSLEGNPPGDPRLPPLPPLTPAQEALYVGRTPLFASDLSGGPQVVTYPFEISDYNPEWISVDVQGYNFVLETGIIEHDCMGSLDLAFVITGGEPTGACCWEDHTCTITTQADCEGAAAPGVWQGPGTACGGMEACCTTTGTCVDADALCCVNELGGVPAGAGTSCIGDITGCCLAAGDCQDYERVCCLAFGGAAQAENCAGALEACCFDDGSCLDIDPVCCDDEAGEPSPSGAVTCMGDINGDGHDDACEPPQACCLPSGACVDVGHTDCVLQGGDPQGPGTVCPPAGDVVCRALKWAQPPTFDATSPTPDCFWGWDEMSLYGWEQIVADDFLCEDAKPITDVHWWGSYDNYMEPVPPPWGPPAFHIGIWTDVPVGPGNPLPYSHPGQMIHQWIAPRNALNERAVGCDFHTGMMDVPDTCFRYDFVIPEQAWFTQEGGPTVYWISIAGHWPIGEQRGVPPWGWKTRRHYFNDDAVRILMPTAPVPGMVFMEGFPIEYPAGTSWDMAFVLTTKSADPPTPPTGQPGYRKIRYISFVPANPGMQTALRVTLTDLPAPFNAFDGLQMWVGEAVTKCENAGQSTPPAGGCGAAPGLPLSFRTAYMQCTPYCMDYGAVGALHVTDDEIVPNAIYDVQAIDCGADFGVEANYSDPLTIRTSKWGDLVGNCAVIPCTPPDGFVNITTDVTAVLDKFKNLPGAVMKSRADMEPNKVEWLVNITDVTYCLDAFLGFTYPPPGWPGPGGCP